MKWMRPRVSATTSSRLIKDLWRAYLVAVCYENGEGVAVDLDEAWRLMNLALAAAQANGDPGGYTSDIHAALPRIKSKQGGGNVAMVMTGPDGTVRTF